MFKATVRRFSLLLSYLVMLRHRWWKLERYWQERPLEYDITVLNQTAPSTDADSVNAVNTGYQQSDARATG